MLNEIMGEASETIESPMVFPELENLSYGGLRNIAAAVEEYWGEVQAMLDEKQQERVAELRARIAADQAELAALQPQPVKMANPSKPKYQDPAKPECTWAGKGKQPGWLKEKLEAGASIEDFLVDKPAAPSSPDDPGF